MDSGSDLGFIAGVERLPLSLGRLPVQTKKGGGGMLVIQVVITIIQFRGKGGNRVGQGGRAGRVGRYPGDWRSAPGLAGEACVAAGKVVARAQLQ